jgi:hypothetical protein
MLVVPNTEIVGAYPPIRRDRRGLDDGEANAARRSLGVMAKMPIRGQAFVGGILAHRR